MSNMNKRERDTFYTSSLQPKQYQKRMIKDALRSNAIVHLPTGSGKTLIAVIVACELMAARLKDGQQRKAILLAPQVSLVQQQSQYIQDHSSLRVRAYYGAMGVDLWDKETWRLQLEECDFFVMSPQVLLNCLRYAYLRMDDVELLVFDEAHHTQNDHPYNVLMKEFYFDSPIGPYRRPKILGLTASPIYAGYKKMGGDAGSKLEKTLFDLENNLDAKLLSSVSGDSSIEGVFEDTKQKTLEEIFIHTEESVQNVNKIQDWANKLFRNESNCISTVISTAMYIISSLGPLCCLKYLKSELALLKRRESRLSSKKFDEKSKTFGVTIECLSNLMNGEHERDGVKMYSSLSHLYSKKVIDLLEFLLLQRKTQLETTLEEDHRMCCIIFVERRATALLLSEVINSTFSRRSEYPIRSSHLVGKKQVAYVTENGDTIYRGDDMDLKNREKVLDRFKKGEILVLVSTSVVEEGIDIKECNLVVRFDNIPTVTSLIQSRGRARDMNSKYVILGDNNMVENFNSMRKFESIIDYRIFDITQRRKSRHANNIPFDIQEENDDLSETKVSLQNSVDLLEDIRPPFLSKSVDEKYIVSPTNASVTMNSSVSLLHYYCSLLPKDAYCNVKPTFRFEGEHFSSVLQDYSNESDDSDDDGDDDDDFDDDEICGEFRCILYLPASSALKMVTGDWKWNKKQAKRSVCLEACKQLHKNGSLDDHLRINLGATTEEDCEDWNEDGRGTKRCVKMYPVGKCLLHAIPWSEVREDELFYLYIVNQKHYPSTHLGLLSLMDVSRALDLGNSGAVDLLYQDEPHQSPSEVKSLNIEFITRVKFSVIQLRKLQYTFGLIFSSAVSAESFRVLTSDVEQLSPLMIVPIKIMYDRKSKEVRLDWEEIERLYMYRNCIAENTLLKFYQQNDFSHFQHMASSLLCISRISYGVKRRIKDVKLLPQELMIRPIFDEEYVAAIKNDEGIEIREFCKRYNLGKFCNEGNLQCGKPAVLLNNISSNRSIRWCDKNSSHRRIHMLRRHSDDNCKRNHYRKSDIYFVDGSDSDQRSSLVISRRREFWELFDGTLENHFIHPIQDQDVIDSIPRLALLLTHIEERFMAVQCSHHLLPRHCLKRTSVLSEALITPSSNHGIDYQRLETLGDSVLKVMISMYVSAKFLHYHEGQLTSARMKLVSNRYLCLRAFNTNLNEYIQTASFLHRKFLPIGYRNNEDVERPISDKTIADIVEGIIGAYYIDSNENFVVIWECLKSLQIIQNADEPIPDLSKLLVASKDDEAHFNISEKDQQIIYTIGEILDYDFQQYSLPYKCLLLEATIHPSFTYNDGNILNRCYQRLEFLGDAVLDVIITRWLYEFEPRLSAEELSNWRSFSVCNDTLGGICHKSGLSSLLRHASDSLFHDIKCYDEGMEQHPPKVLGDMLEAILGAVFIVENGNVDTITRIVDRLVIQDYLKPALSKEYSLPISRFLPRWGIEIPAVALLSQFADYLKCKRCLNVSFNENGDCIIYSHGKKLSIGSGRNKKEAKMKACHQLFGGESLERHRCFQSLKDICNAYAKKSSSR